MYCGLALPPNLPFFKEVYMKGYVVRSVLVLSLLFMNVGIAQAGNWYASLQGGVGTGPESEAEVEDILG